jgi:small GTP-binding protein
MLLGDIGVGKTSLARRLVFDRFEADYKATIGVDIYTHEITAQVRGTAVPVTLVIWDVDGDFGESIFGHSYIRGAAAAMIIADRTRASTVQSMLGLSRQFEDQLPGRPVRLVVNKSDLTAADDAPIAGARKLAGSSLIETSAKSGAHVAEAFQAIAAELLARGM